MAAAADNPIVTVNGEVAALRRELNLIWEAHAREHKAHDQAHDREHSFTAEAIKVAAALAEKNKADANEWRGSMTDRETRFATKEDVKAVGAAVHKLEDAEIRRAEAERLRLLGEAEARRQDERRQARGQWITGIIVGVIVTIGSILLNLALRPA